MSEAVDVIEHYDAIMGDDLDLKSRTCVRSICLP